MIQLQTTIEISASPEWVWGRLVDLDSYPAWNPFTPQVVGKLSPGAPLKITARLLNRFIATPHQVVDFIPPRLLSWKMIGPPDWLLHAIRYQQLEEVGPNLTRLVNRYEMGGLLSPLVHWIMSPGILAGMQQVSIALQKEVTANP